MKINLPPEMIKAVDTAVDKLFQKARARFLGRIPPGTAKQLIFSLKPEHSIPALFNTAAKIEGATPNAELLNSVASIGLKYLDAIKEKTKAQTIHNVQSFMSNSVNKKIEPDFEKILGGEISDLWTKTTNEVKKVIETETTVARNMSTMDALTKINASAGITDPTVFFIIVRDGSVCSECLRLHMLENGVTPRVWKLSEVGAGYHKKGESDPKIGGLHPHCRCTMSTLFPGYGFSSGGFVEYKESGWDEYAHQHR